MNPFLTKLAHSLTLETPQRKVGTSWDSSVKKFVISLVQLAPWLGHEDQEPLIINKLQIGIHLALQECLMNRKILIVEDDEALLKILQLLLENSYDVTLAMNGKQGLEMATSQHPDLILMDVMMPEIDGLEALRRLKDNPEMARIPVILLTAKVDDENIYGGYQLGADYYIPKPFTNAQLLNGINMFLAPQKAAIGS